VLTNSNWFPANTIVEEQTLTAQMSNRQLEKLTDNVSVILSIAVEFGTFGFTGAPVEVKYADCGKGVILCFGFRVSGFGFTSVQPLFLRFDAL
jgi:hypothetical protein